MDESRRDFSSQISLAQKQLSSANLADSSQYQQLIGNLASELQNNGSGNMIGVYLMSGDDSNIDEKTFVPVSTEPEYTNLISTEMQNDLQSDSDDSIYYQAVNIAKSEKGTPGAILGSTISSNGIGTVKIFALYSYQTQQQALLQIQFNMLVSDVLLSIAIVVIIFSVMRSVVKPVQDVAASAETMASGNLDIRVQVNRQDEIGVLQRSFNEMADSLVQKIDELEKALPSYKLTTPIFVINELKGLKRNNKGKIRLNADLALKLANSSNIEIKDISLENNETVDDALLRVSEVLATNDIELKKRARKKGITVAYLRQKKYIAIDGKI